MAIEVGSIVYLKSGGPPTTVTQIVGSDAELQWFAGSQRQSVVVPLAGLTEVDPEPGLRKARESQEGTL